MNAKQIGGWSLIGAGAASILAMAHHPTSYHAAIGPTVHGVMIFVLLVIAFGFAAFVLDRGVGRPAILAGAIAYAVSTFANLGAGTINGFIAPALAQGDAAIAQDILLLCWTANQTLAWLGVVTAGAAFLFWSLDLLRGPRPAARLIGVAGLAAGALPTILLVTGVLSLNATGAAILYAAQVAWGALVGLLMLAEAAPKRPADGVAP